MTLALCSQSCEPISKNLLKDYCTEKVTGIWGLWKYGEYGHMWIFTSSHTPLTSSEAPREVCGVAHSHDLWVGLPNYTKGTQVFRCSHGFSSKLVLAPLFWHNTWKPWENPLWGWGLSSSFLPGHDAWPCIQMWTRQLCRSRSTVQGCGRRELLQLPQTKYLPALVLGWISLDVCQTHCLFASGQLFLPGWWTDKCLWVGRYVTSWIPE